MNNENNRDDMQVLKEFVDEVQAHQEEAHQAKAFYLHVNQTIDDLQEERLAVTEDDLSTTFDTSESTFEEGNDPDPTSDTALLDKMVVGVAQEIGEVNTEQMSQVEIDAIVREVLANSENPVDYEQIKMQQAMGVMPRVEKQQILDMPLYVQEEKKDNQQDEIDSIVKEVLSKMENPVHMSDTDANRVKESLQKLDEDMVVSTVLSKKAIQQAQQEEKDTQEKQVVAFDMGEYDKYGRKKPRARYYVGIGFFTFCNICAIACFVIAYGPFNYLRDMFVTTAMRTMTHKYLANVLYSTETIQEILATNITVEPDEVMDSSAISVGNLSESNVYSSIYEEQVLKKDEGNDLYKVIRLNENGYKGYITFVYDPTKIDLSVTRYLGTIGEYVSKHGKVNKAHVAINGGGFVDYGGNGSGGQPTGYVIKKGKIVWSRQRGSSWGGGTIGFDENGILILTKKQGKAALKEGIYNGVDFGPFLIVNGKSAEVSGNGGWGVHPRTIIGQRQDGIVVFLTIDGRSATSLGVDLNTCITILQRYNVYNAANLDGGASTVLWVEGEVKNNPVAYTSSGEREVPTAWIVVD